MIRLSNTRQYAKKRKVTPLTVAGVTIATLTGDNGLLTKAGEAKKQELYMKLITKGL